MPQRKRKLFYRLKNFPRRAAALEQAGIGGDTDFINANTKDFIKALNGVMMQFREAGERECKGDDKEDDKGNDKGINPLVNSNGGDANDKGIHPLVNNNDNDNVIEDKEFLKAQLEIIKSACENYDDTAIYQALDKLKETPLTKETAEALETIRELIYTLSDFDAAGERLLNLLK